MELQPLVGSPCAFCQQRILVAFDAANCDRCGLALHTSHVADHAPQCTGQPALARPSRDYDEVAPFRLTTAVTALLAAGAFAVLFGLGMLTSSPTPAAGTLGAEGVIDEGASRRATIGWSAVAGGIVLAAAGAVTGRPRA